MQLYVLHASPNARKTIMLVHHLDLDVEIRIVDLSKGEQRAPEYLAINPNGKVPTLVDGDFKLWESNAILQYLARGTTLFPDDARAQADILRWQCWELAHFGKAVGTIAWENVAKPTLGLGEPDQNIVAMGLEEFHRYAPVLNSQLDGRQWVTGEELTLADISLGSHLMYAAPGQVPIGDYPNIQAWWQRFEQLPAWQASAPPSMP